MGMLVGLLCLVFFAHVQGPPAASLGTTQSPVAAFALARPSEAARRFTGVLNSAPGGGRGAKGLKGSDDSQAVLRGGASGASGKAF